MYSVVMLTVSKSFGRGEFKFEFEFELELSFEILLSNLLSDGLRYSIANLLYL